MDAPMPGGSGPVRIARLPSVAAGDFRAFVRFPPGWSRPGPGHYEVAEDVLILEGDLTLNGLDLPAGTYAHAPARCIRCNMLTRKGCLAFAWFSGPPRWIPGAPAEPATPGISFQPWRP